MDMSARRDQTPRPPDIRVHIDRIVLIGVDPRDREALGAAVEGEMTRLFTERGWPRAPEASGDAERLDAGQFRHSDASRVGELGAQIGASVHGGLTR